jgi:hypothetical protein
MVNKIIGAIVQGAGNTASYMGDKALEASAAKKQGTNVEPQDLTREDPGAVQTGQLKAAGNFIGGGAGNAAAGAGGIFSKLGTMSDERKKRDKKPTGEFVHRLHKLGDRLGIQRDFDDLDFRDLNLGNNKQTPPTKADRERKDQERKYWSDMNAMRGSDERIKEKEDQPDMVEEVAENIQNYRYHYKPGSGEDPTVEYSGPMAQDLLQVDGYRSAVFEDENGLLRVDTGRLALVNAGLIADISARLILLETLIREVMEALPQMEEQIVPDVE